MNFWLQIDEMIYYFKIASDKELFTEKISLMQYHMISGKKTVFQEQKYNPQEVQLLEKDETFKMDRVYGITFVQNKTDQSLLLSELYVALI